MGGHQAVPAEQTAWRATGERPARAQRDPLGPAFGCAVARAHGRIFLRKRNRKEAICFSPYLYKTRNLVERFFNKIKQCRRIATRYDKLAANYLAFIKLASIRLWLRANESTPTKSENRIGLR